MFGFLKSKANNTAIADKSHITVFISPTNHGATHHLSSTHTHPRRALCGTIISYQGAEVNKDYIKKVWKEQNDNWNICLACAVIYVGPEVHSWERNDW